MGTINVEGIGTVQIQGDQPTPEEAKTIFELTKRQKIKIIKKRILNFKKDFIRF